MSHASEASADLNRGGIGEGCATMSPAQKTIQCGICGHEMAIPPGYENVVGRCRICGGTVSATESPPASRLDDTIRSARPKPQPTSAENLRKVRIAALQGLVVGALGALAGGVVITVFYFLRGHTGEQATIAAFFASADPGILAGFVICSSWAVIRRLALGPLMGLLVGASVGLVMGTLMHVMESALVAPPEVRVWVAGLLSLLGGGVVGFILGETVGSPND